MNRVCKGIIAAVLSITLWSALIPIRGAEALMFARSSRKSVGPHVRSSSLMDPTYYTISGNAGVGGARMEWGGTPVISLPDGWYEIRVPSNWSGRVTPSKPCYTFTPPYKDYSRVKSNKTQNYTATNPTNTISGTVRKSDGSGMGGVTLTYTDGTEKTATTNSNGVYSFRVPCGWSGRVTPSLVGYSFVPEYYNYSPVTSDKANQDYRANLVPTDILLSPDSVAENLDGGATVGSLTTIDPDGNLPTYSFCGGSDDGYFTLNGSNLKTAGRFDFETRRAYWTCILTNDGKGGKRQEEFRILVTDVNEPPTNIVLSPGSIIENQRVGATIGNLTTTDPDTTDHHRYILTNGSGCADKGFFGIDHDELYLGKNIPDFDVKQQYSICIRSTDGGGLFYGKRLTLGVIPTFRISGRTNIGGYDVIYDGAYPSNGRLIDRSGRFTSPGPSYNLIIPLRWRGDVWLVKAGYVFRVSDDPRKSVRTYRPVVSNQLNQDFRARPKIRGNVGVGDARVCYEDDGQKCVRTDANGFFEIHVPFCWSGTIRPIKQDYTFSQPTRSFSCVEEPRSGIRFEAKLIPPTIQYPEDGSTLFEDQPTIEWANMSSAESYVLSVCDPSNDCPVTEQRVTCSEACTYTIGPLKIGKVYTLSMKAQDQWGHGGEWARVHFFMGVRFTFDDPLRDPFDEQSWEAHPVGSWSLHPDGYIFTNGEAEKTSSASYTRRLDNFAIEARLWADPASEENGLIIRGSPVFNGQNDWTTAYYFQIFFQDRTFRVVRFLGGQRQPIGGGPASIDRNTWNTLKVSAYDNHLIFYVNGAKVWEGDDDNPIYEGRVGIYTFGAHWLRADDATLWMPERKPER